MKVHNISFFILDRTKIEETKDIEKKDCNIISSNSFNKESRKSPLSTYQNATDKKKRETQLSPRKDHNISLPHFKTNNINKEKNIEKKKEFITHQLQNVTYSSVFRGHRISTPVDVIGRGLTRPRIRGKQTPMRIKLRHCFGEDWMEFKWVS